MGCGRRVDFPRGCRAGSIAPDSASPISMRGSSAMSWLVHVLHAQLRGLTSLALHSAKFDLGNIHECHRPSLRVWSGGTYVGSVHVQVTSTGAGQLQLFVAMAEAWRRPRKRTTCTAANSLVAVFSSRSKYDVYLVTLAYEFKFDRTGTRTQRTKRIKFK